MQIEHNVKAPAGNSERATPVLMLHGAWHGAWCYDLWMDDFAAHGYEAHSMSLPAHGKSGRDKSITLYSLGDYAEALAQVVSQITPTPFVIGHSLGGFVLQEYLKTRQLPGAVLLCTIPVFGALPFYLRYFRKHPARYLWSLASTRLGDLVNTPELAAELFLTEGSAISPQELAPRLVNEALWAAIQVAFLKRGDPKRVTTPILVVAAERDGIFLPGEEKQTAEAYGADYLLIEGQGHNLMVERKWPEVAADIRAWFLKR